MNRCLAYLCMFFFSMFSFYGCNDDVDPKNNLMGEWGPRPGGSMYIAWESSANLSAGELNMPVAAAALLATEYGNIVLQDKLRRIGLRVNDYVWAEYSDESRFVVEEYGRYKVVSKDKLLFYPDVDKLFKGLDMDDVTLTEIRVLSRLGIPVKYVFAGRNHSEIYFYLETKTIKEMKVFFPVLASAISGDSANDLIVKSILSALPDALNRTDKIEIGLSFYNVSP